MKRRFRTRFVLVGLTLSLLGAAATTSSALADNGADVQNYGTCVTYGIDPSSGGPAPYTVVTNEVHDVAALPHQSVDGNPPPAFDPNTGWSACGR